MAPGPTARPHLAGCQVLPDKEKDPSSFRVIVLNWPGKTWHRTQAPDPESLLLG